MSNTATVHTVFVVGQEALGNREIVIVENGDLYDLSASTITAYTNANTKFPYTAET